MPAARPIRVIVAKPGLDGHDKGARVVAMALKDAGMEVIYSGIRQSLDGIVSAALQEDADVIGLSILSGAHLPICEEFMARVRSAGLSDVLVLVGGIIPKADVQRLKDMGVAEVFRPGSKLDDIVHFVRQETSRRS
jgi:methylmalonyl-CoA mutase C-terminal domain/subunit